MKSAPSLFYKYCETCLQQRAVIFDLQKLTSELRKIQTYVENNTIKFDADKGVEVTETLVDCANSIKATIDRKIAEHQN